ncbi:MAG: tRNA pseudouridine(55) synthase TruB [Marmoricola sp.]
MSEPSAGLVVVDKPGGMTSHDVVARVRRLAGTRKVGHAGTLDPMATGVLVLGVGRATRLLGHLLLTEKAYDATVRLGAATTTDDAEGEQVSTAETRAIREDAVREQLGRLVGEIDQVPSTVSAIKVDGRRAYARARAGEAVQLAARRVTVHGIDVHEVRRAEGFLDVDLSVRCSSGTYVRAIARDLGDALGVGGHLTALRRTAVGPFTLDDARTLDQLQEAYAVLPMEDACARVFPRHTVDEAGERDVRVGRALEVTLPTPGPVAVYGPDGDFLALYEQRGDGARAVAVFC